MFVPFFFGLKCLKCRSLCQIAFKEKCKKARAARTQRRQEGRNDAETLRKKKTARQIRKDGRKAVQLEHEQKDREEFERLKSQGKSKYEKTDPDVSVLCFSFLKFQIIFFFCHSHHHSPDSHHLHVWRWCVLTQLREGPCILWVSWPQASPCE
jgi:hypothetical protein